MKHLSYLISAFLILLICLLQTKVANAWTALDLYRKGYSILYEGYADVEECESEKPIQVGPYTVICSSFSYPYHYGEVILMGKYETYKEMKFLMAYLCLIGSDDGDECESVDEIYVKSTPTFPTLRTQPTQPIPNQTTTPRVAKTGTGFFVHRNLIITADHVLDSCTTVKVRSSRRDYRTTVVARDPKYDLSLLRVEGLFTRAAVFRGGKNIRLGERIATYGYPLSGILSDSAKITQGNINSLAGLKNDVSVFQYDAPSQPGNSGGPVLDSSGNVVGVVSHGLSKKYADHSGHIAQNVNFAVKSHLVERFLSSNNVSFEKADSTQKLELPDIAEKAERFTVLVGCWE